MCSVLISMVTMPLPAGSHQKCQATLAAASLNELNMLLSVVWMRFVKMTWQEP